MATSEWLEARRTHITGTDVGIICGVNQYTTPYELWFEKTTGLSKFQDNDATLLGRHLEPFVGILFEDQTGKAIQTHPSEPFPNTTTLVLNHEGKDVTIYKPINQTIFAGTPDAFVINNGEYNVLEIKTMNPNYYQYLKKQGKEYPESYYLQVQHYMYCTGLNKAWLAIYVHGQYKLNIHEISLDEKYVNEIVPLLKEWYDAHILNEHPPLEGMPERPEDIEEESFVYSNRDIEKKLQRLVTLREQRKAIEVEEGYLENEIKTMLSEAENMVNAQGDIIASYKYRKSSRFDSALFQKENPDIANKYIKDNSYRVLTLSKTIKPTTEENSWL